jgi:GTP cyclohydrolase II
VVSSSKVKQVASADFPTRWGRFLIHGFATRATASGDGAKTEEAVALVMGEVHSGSPLVRIHSQCLTGDVFGSLRCDCRQQLEMALSMIAQLGAGVLIYEHQEGTADLTPWKRTNALVSKPTSASFLCRSRS